MAGFDWGDIINAALAVYGIKQGQKPPKFYPVPPTPQETWKDDATRNLASYASQYTDQFMKGLGNMNPDFKLNTNLVGNPSFMGGIQLPHFDFSKTPAPGAAAATPAAQPPTAGVGAGTPVGQPNPGDAGFGQTPNGPGFGLQDAPPNLTPTDWGKLKQLYGTYGKDAGAFVSAAMSGNIIGMTVAVAKGIWDHFHQAQPLPNNPITDPNLVKPPADPNSPWTAVDGPNLPPRENWGPTGPEQSGRDFIQNQNDRLGGEGGYSQGGYGGGGNPWFDGIGRPLY